MAIHSRAFLLLRRDLVSVQRYPITGISVSPSNPLDLFHWSVKIEGLSDTIWEGGVFQLSLTFSQDFNSRPPSVKFMTIPFHPNINPVDGSPSFHLISEQDWSSENYTTLSLLLALQTLLSNPELDDGCISNLEAARLCREAPHTYKQMVLDCVAASLRIDAGLTPYEQEQEPPAPAEPTATPPPHSRTPSSRPISFDEYHVLWKGIATSLSDKKPKAVFNKMMNKDTHSHSRTDQCISEIEEKFEKTLEIKYGRPPKTATDLTSTESRLRRVECLKSMYKASLHTSNTAETSECVEDPSGDMGDEVNMLVEWTKELDHDELST